MKKLLFVAALGVVGLVSAKDLIGKESEKKADEKPKKEVKSSKNLDLGDNCITITTSCGAPLWYCGDGKTSDRLQELMDAGEAIFCGGN